MSAAGVAGQASPNQLLRMKMLLSRIWAGMTAAAILVSANRLSAAEPAPSAAGDGGLVARGKGFAVERRQLDEALAIFDAGVARDSRPVTEPRAVILSRLLAHIIDTDILMQRATAEKSKARETMAATEAAERRKFGGETDFTNWLAATGMTLRQYRSRATEQAACEAVIDRELRSCVSISDEAVKKYYEENAAAFDRPEQVRARQIVLLAVDPATGDPLSAEKIREKEQQAQALKARLDQGANFFELFRQYSELPGAKEETETSEPLLVRGQAPPELDNAVFALATNQVSGVIKTRLGFHLVRVSEKQPATRLSLAEVAPRLKDFLASSETKKMLPAYLEQNRKAAAVEILDPELAAQTSLGAVTKADHQP